MKNILLVLTILLTPTICFSDVYVYTQKDTDEVLFITEKPNVVINEAEKDNIVETVLPKDIAFYDLTEAYSDYKLTNKKFVLNTKKISDRENAILAAKEAEAKKASDFESAKQKLIDLGLTNDEVLSLRR